MYKVPVIVMLVWESRPYFEGLQNFTGMVTIEHPILESSGIRLNKSSNFQSNSG